MKSTLKEERLEERAWVFDRTGLHSVPAPGRQLPANIVDPFAYFFYNQLIITVTYDDKFVELASRMLNISHRSFSNGKILEVTAKRIKRVHPYKVGPFIPDGWEDNARAKIIRFAFICGNCERRHPIYAPFMPGDSINGARQV